MPNGIFESVEHHPLFYRSDKFYMCFCRNVRGDNYLVCHYSSGCAFLGRHPNFFFNFLDNSCISERDTMEPACPCIASKWFSRIIVD